MKAIGASYATLVFVNDSSTEMVIDQENFDANLSRSVVPGGGIAKYGGRRRKTIPVRAGAATI